MPKSQPSRFNNMVKGSTTRTGGMLPRMGARQVGRIKTGQTVGRVKSRFVKI